MFCCLFRRLSGTDFIYGVLDTSDGTVEEYRANTLVSLMRKGIDILGLRLDVDYLSYLGGSTTKYVLNDYFEHNGCVAAVNIVHSNTFGGCCVCEVSIFKQGIGFVRNVLVGRLADNMRTVSLQVDLRNDVISIIFEFTDKNCYGEDRPQDFWKYMFINTKTCEYKLDKGWKMARR